MLDTLYCEQCQAQTLPTDNELCGWCDHPLLDVVNEPLPGGNLRPLPSHAKEAGKHRWYKERKDRGRPRNFTVEQADEAWTWYEQGLSLRQCAERLYPDTTSASVKACSNALHTTWLAAGRQLRGRVEASVKASTIHGLGRDPAHRRAQRMARGELRDVYCNGVTIKGVACSRPALAGGEWCIYHDPVRGPSMQEALARGRREHAKKHHGDGRPGRARPCGERSGSAAAATADGERDDLDSVPGLAADGQGDPRRLLRVAHAPAGDEWPVQGAVPAVVGDPPRGEAEASAVA